MRALDVLLDCGLVAAAAACSYHRLQRHALLMKFGVVKTAFSIFVFPMHTFLGPFVNLLSLCGTMFAATLRRSQALFSFLTCLTDWYIIGQELPTQRSWILLSFFLITTASVAANLYMLFHRIGAPLCAWTAGVGSVLFLIREGMMSPPPLTLLFVSSQTKNLLLLEKLFSVVGCAMYLLMLVYDDSNLNVKRETEDVSTNLEPHAVGLSISLTESWLPWVVTYVGILFSEVIIVARAWDAGRAPVRSDGSSPVGSPVDV